MLLLFLKYQHPITGITLSRLTGILRWLLPDKPTLI